MYKMLQVVGTSPKGFSEAVENGIKTLEKKGEKVYWFEVVEQRGAVREGKISEYQVKIDVGLKSGK